MDNETKPDETPPPVLGNAADLPAQVRNDEEAFERLYCDLERLCLRMSRRKFGIPEDDMKTIVHDVFISYLANPTVVRGQPRTYLISAIYYQSQNYWRSKRYENRVFSDDDVRELDETGRATSDDFFDELCLGLDVLTTLDKLDVRCREALTRCAMDEEPDAIAEALHTTPNNVYNVIHKCRKRARVIYESLTQVQVNADI